MKRYNHMFTLAFSMTTPHTGREDDYPSDLEFHEAISQRLRDIDRDGWQECIGAPDDTYVEVDDDDEGEGGKFWIVTYEHKYGFDTWPIYRPMTEKEVIETLVDWEGPDKQEYITITGPFYTPEEN